MFCCIDRPAVGVETRHPVSISFFGGLLSTVAPVHWKEGRERCLLVQCGGSPAIADH